MGVTRSNSPTVTPAKPGLTGERNRINQAGLDTIKPTARSAVHITMGQPLPVKEINDKCRIDTVRIEIEYITRGRSALRAAQPRENRPDHRPRAPCRPRTSPPSFSLAGVLRIRPTGHQRQKVSRCSCRGMTQSGAFCVHILIAQQTVLPKAGGFPLCIS